MCVCAVFQDVVCGCDVLQELSERVAAGCAKSSSTHSQKAFAEVSLVSDAYYFSLGSIWQWWGLIV